MFFFCVHFKTKKTVFANTKSHNDIKYHKYHKKKTKRRSRKLKHKNTQAFIQAAENIYGKIERGIIDPSNDIYGVKSGLADPNVKVSKKKNEKTSCCR